MKKPYILLVNDDGIKAPGILSLWRAIKDFAEVSIIAPNTQQSGKGLGITLGQPILAKPYRWEDSQVKAWAVNGTPADCIKVGFSVILKRKPDFILSGINRGCNSGRNALYSGTIGGVIEGVFRGIPGIAFSCKEYKDPKYGSFEPFIPQIVQHFIDHPMPKNTLINVNFPKGHGTTIKGIKWAKQGQSYWVEDFQKSDDAGHHFGAKWLTIEDEDEHSDVVWLQNGYITAVPLYVGDVTHHKHFKHHQTSFDKLNLTLFD